MAALSCFLLLNEIESGDAVTFLSCAGSDSDLSTALLSALSGVFANGLTSWLYVSLGFIGELIKITSYFQKRVYGIGTLEYNLSFILYIFYTSPKIVIRSLLQLSAYEPWCRYH